MTGRVKLFRLLAAFTCVALIGAACGGDGSGEATGDGEVRKETTSKVLGGSASEGGTLRLASVGDVDYMDPGQAYTVTFFAYVARGVFRTLTTYPAGPDLAEQNTVVPDLAEDLGQVNADNTQWTYTLKDNIKFGPALGGEEVPGVTGEEITSADIKYAIERLFLPSVGAGYATYYEEIEGVEEFASGKADEITGIETPDDKTIVFNLSQPLGDFDYRVAMPAAAPVPEEFASRFDKEKDSNYESKSVSSGPYYVAEHVPNETVVMKRNEFWESSTDEVRKAYVDEVNWKQGFEANVCIQKVLDGDYHHAVTDCQIEGPLLQKVVTTPEYEEKLFNLPIACGSYIFMNTTVKPLTDVKVRQAVNFAIDKSNLSRLGGGTLKGEIATSILPPGMDGHLPSSEYDPYKTSNYSGDMEKAKQLMAEAGYPDGYDGKLLLVGDAEGAGPKQTESVRADLEELGFSNLEIKQLTFPDYYTQYYNEPETNTAFGFSGWCQDYPSPVTYMKPLLYGPNILQNGNSAYAELDDPDLNAQIEKAETLSGADATAAWEEANRMATELAPWVTTRWQIEASVVSDQVTNAYFNTYYDAVDWVNMGVKS